MSELSRRISSLQEVAVGEAEERARLARDKHPQVDVLSVFDPRADFLRRSGVSAPESFKPVITSGDVELIAEGRVVDIERKLVSLGLELGDNPRAKEAREALKGYSKQDVGRRYVVVPPVK